MNSFSFETLTKLPLLTQNGVYIIINKVNNRFYLGSAVNFHRRWVKHLGQLKNNTHHNITLQNAFNKYGLENFELQILELVDNRDDLKDTEQAYLDYMNKEDAYNISNQAGGGKLKDKVSLETRLKQSQAGKRRKHSEETKAKLAAATKVNKVNLFASGISYHKAYKRVKAYYRVSFVVEGKVKEFGNFKNLGEAFKRSIEVRKELNRWYCIYKSSYGFYTTYYRGHNLKAIPNTSKWPIMYIV